MLVPVSARIIQYQWFSEWVFNPGHSSPFIEVLVSSFAHALQVRHEDAIIDLLCYLLLLSLHSGRACGDSFAGGLAPCLASKSRSVSSATEHLHRLLPQGEKGRSSKAGGVGGRGHPHSCELELSLIYGMEISSFFLLFFLDKGTTFTHSSFLSLSLSLFLSLSLSLSLSLPPCTVASVSPRRWNTARSVSKQRRRKRNCSNLFPRNPTQLSLRQQLTRVYWD